MPAKGGRTADGDPPEEDGEEDEEADPDRFDLLDVINGMATHFHEKRMDIISTWSWKLFMTEWAIMIDEVSKEKEREEEREAKREEMRIKQDVESAHYRAMTE